MNLMVLLDTGVLGNVTNPNSKQSDNLACLIWLGSLPLRGYEVAIPEIADYELRRELLRGEKVNGIQKLDNLNNSSDILGSDNAIRTKLMEVGMRFNQGRLQV